LEGRREGSPEYWVRALEGLERSVSRIVGEGWRAWASVLEVVRENLGVVLASSRLGDLVLGRGLAEAYGRALGGAAVGVDSSRTGLVRLGFRYVSLVSGAAVDVQGRGRVVFMGVEPVVLPDEAAPEHVELELGLEMFRLEVEALEAGAGHARGGTLMLDGPLVDPPGMAGPAERAGMAGKYVEYVGRRARAIRGAVEAGTVTLGYVKRVSGRIFASWLREELGAGELDRVNDLFLGAVIARALRGPLTRDACAREGMVVATAPLELDESRVPDYRLYREHGLRVYTSLVVPGFCRGNMRPARIEVHVPPGGDPVRAVLEAAAAVEAWMVEGAWLPAPVLAAHRACTIRGRESLRLLREAGSLYAREVLDRLGDDAALGLMGLFD